MLRNYNRRWMINVTNKKPNIRIHTEIKTTKTETTTTLNRSYLIRFLLSFLCKSKCVN